MVQWPDDNSASKQLYDRALQVLPGGITRLLPWQDPYPVYAERGEGAYVIDVDGTARLDFLNNFASLIHGHAYGPVVEAIREQVGLGTAFTNPTESEVALAELICARIDSVDSVRFCVSGTEAVMNAIKAARALTGKPKIVKIEGAYHGTYDYAEVSLDPTPENWGNDPNSVAHAHGTPEAVLKDVAVIPFDDPEAAARIITANGNQLAAVLLDPAPAYLGMRMMTPEFAQTIQRAARQVGAMIICDEVISFRFDYNGAAQLVGLQPDYVTLAKIIGGGFPVGAVCGTHNAMSVFDHRKGKPLLPASGTFTANPISMVAGRVALENMPPEKYAMLNALGDRVRSKLTEAIDASGYPASVSGYGSIFMIHMNKRTLTDYRTVYATKEEKYAALELQRLMTLAGYQISGKGMGFLSTVMTNVEIDRFAEATGQCLEQMLAAT